jgi:hypothetical protein
MAAKKLGRAGSFKPLYTGRDNEDMTMAGSRFRLFPSDERRQSSPRGVYAGGGAAMLQVRAAACEDGRPARDLHKQPRSIWCAAPPYASLHKLNWAYQVGPLRLLSARWR